MHSSLLSGTAKEKEITCILFLMHLIPFLTIFDGTIFISTDSSRQTYLKYKRKVEAVESCQSPQKKRMKTAGAQVCTQTVLCFNGGIFQNNN